MNREELEQRSRTVATTDPSVSWVDTWKAVPFDTALRLVSENHHYRESLREVCPKLEACEKANERMKEYVRTWADKHCVLMAESDPRRLLHEQFVELTALRERVKLLEEFIARAIPSPHHQKETSHE